MGLEFSKTSSFAVFLHYLAPAVRGSRPGKNVQLSEAEIRGLCLKSREIFLSQPILLELEAPLKICGEWVSHIARFSSVWLGVTINTSKEFC